MEKVNNFLLIFLRGFHGFGDFITLFIAKKLYPYFLLFAPCRNDKFLKGLSNVLTVNLLVQFRTEILLKTFIPSFILRYPFLVSKSLYLRP